MNRAAPSGESETPLHELPGISRKVGHRVYVKRDDLTGLAFGGNTPDQIATGLLIPLEFEQVPGLGFFEQRIE